MYAKGKPATQEVHTYKCNQTNSDSMKALFI